MKPHILRKSLFISSFFLIFLVLLLLGGYNRPLSDMGIDVLSVLAYIVALVWMFHSYKNIKDNHRCKDDN